MRISHRSSTRVILTITSQSPGQATRVNDSNRTKTPIEYFDIKLSSFLAAWHLEPDDVSTARPLHAELKFGGAVQLILDFCRFSDWQRHIIANCLIRRRYLASVTTPSSHHQDGSRQLDRASWGIRITVWCAQSVWCKRNDVHCNANNVLGQKLV